LQVAQQRCALPFLLINSSARRRDRRVPLSARSHRFLALQAEHRCDFVEEYGSPRQYSQPRRGIIYRVGRYKSRSFESRSCITCVATLLLSRCEPDSACTVVLGLENDSVAVLKAECKVRQAMVAHRVGR
jgi:hypothetical protein